MDILALALGGAPNPDNEAAKPVEAGFDSALTQAQDQGEGVPPGGPPGPEPPPTVKVAGEGVTINEPNAQSKTPDFLPLPEGNVDAVAQALTEGQDAPVTGGICPSPNDDSDTGTDAPDNEVFIETYIAQLTPGLFASPQAIATVTVPTETPSADVSAINAVDGQATTPNDVSFTIPQENAQPTFELPQGEPFVATAPAIVPTGNPIGTPPENQTPPMATAPAIEGQTPPAAPAPALLEGLPEDAAKVLNVQSVLSDQSDLSDPDAKVDAEAPAPQKVQKDTDGAPVALRHPSEKPAKPEDVLEKRPIGQKTETDVPAEKPVKQGDLAEKVQRGDKPAKDAEPVQAIDTAKAADTKGAQPDAKQGDTAQKGSQEPVKSVEKTKAKDEPVVEAVQTAPTETVSSTTVRTSMETTTVAPAKNDQPLPPKEVDLVVKQVADRLQMLAAARPKNGVTVHLNPDDLGTITLVVKSIGQQVDAQFFASDQRVCQALDQNQTRLTEAMGQRGFQLQSVTVSQQANNSTNSQSQQQHRDWQSQTTQQGQNDQARQQQGQGERQPRHYRQEMAAVEPEHAWRSRFATSGVDLEI